MALTKIGTDGVKDDAVTSDKVANAINSAIAANTAKTSLEDESVTLAKLEHGTSSNDGKFLRANNGADPTFETVTGTTINNNADNRLITGSGTANTLNAESNVVIDSSGRVGIGVTNPDTLVHVKNTSASPLQRFESSSYSSFIGTAQANDNAGNGSKAGNLVLRGQTGVAIMGNNGTTTQVKIDADGLKFGSDTAAANALDDYEEGSFTPVPDAGGGVTFSIHHQVGFYTKIGNTVTFQLYLMFYASTITSGNAGNGLAIQGLPFTIKNNNRYNPSFTIGRTYNFDIDSDKRVYAYGDYNSTNIRMIVESDDFVGGLLTAGQVDKSTCLTTISGTYQI